VFDPLALTLILAANKQFEWARQGTGGFVHDDPKYEPDDGALTEQQIETLRKVATTEPPPQEPPPHQSDTHPYLTQGFAYPPGWMFHPPMVAKPDEISLVDDHEEIESDDFELKAAIKQWKAENPDDTIKNQRHKFIRGEINELPWMRLVADNGRAENRTGFGTSFPETATKGDTFVRVDTVPNVVYKFNGTNWIAVDKNLSDSYTYDSAYIEHLINKISTGEYDPELLSDSERQQLEMHLQTIKANNEIK
jgi:hypothetical protein